MNRLLLQFRSLLFRSGEKRASWYRKKSILGSVGNNVMIQDFRLPYNPENVFIGNNVRVATGVMFVTHDVSYHMLNNLYNTNEYKENVGSITIGDNVFIGSRAIIMYDVTVGNNVIIGAGSVVTKDIPDDCVCAGVPCKVIGKFEDFCEKRRND